MSRRLETDDSLAALSPEDRAAVLALREALTFLCDGLREAKRRFEAGEDAGRDGAIHALETVQKFLFRFPLMRDEGLNAPLAVLLDALVHLDKDAVQPILKTSRPPGRTPASAMREGLIGLAVFTVRRLVETKLPVAEAHARVAKALCRAGVKAARGKDPAEITPRTILGWCERVAADVGGHGDAAQTLKELEAEVARPEDLPPEMVRVLYLDWLADYIRHTRGQEST